MKRKDFIKSSSLLVAGGVLTSNLSCDTKSKKAVRKNWAGNYTYKADGYYEPASVEELQQLVKKLDKQKALGSRHCFNDIADSPKNQISTRQLNKVMSVDTDKGTVTIQSGVRYGDFAAELDSKGYALHNLASLPHITVAGACSTATHGSGVALGNLATHVVAMEIVNPQGQIVKIDRTHPEFLGSIVGLGALGIIITVTLELERLSR